MTTLLNHLEAYLKRHLTAFSRIDPARDWIILLLLSVMAIMGIIVWNAWAFDTVASGGTIGTPATSTPALFDRSSLDVVHAIFTDRAVEEQKYASSTYQFADPSQ